MAPTAEKTGAIASCIMRALLEQRAEFLSFTKSRLFDSAAAEDVLQAAYARALEHQEELRSPDRAVAWFYRILRNAIADYYRHQSSEGRIFTHPDQMPDVPASSPAARSCECIPAELEHINPGYADALRELEMRDASVAAYADSRNITPANASVRLHRARKALRQRADLVCGACAGAGCFNCTCQPSSID